MTENHNNHICTAHGISRRDFLKASSRMAMIAAGTSILGGASLLSACNTKKEQPKLKIGYLPITDATPLLIGHAKGLFEQEGISVEQPVLIRGWSEIAEAFLAGTFNLVHLLIPVPIYMRYAQNHPVKIVAWNHMNGSALTVGMKSGIGKLEDMGGKQIAVPYWYSMHNIILQLCMRQFGLEVVVQDRNIPLKPTAIKLRQHP